MGFRVEIAPERRCCVFLPSALLSHLYGYGFVCFKGYFSQSESQNVRIEVSSQFPPTILPASTNGLEITAPAELKTKAPACLRLGAASFPFRPESFG